MVEPLSYCFSQCTTINKDYDMCYSVYGMVHIKASLLLIEINRACNDGSGFPFSLSE